MCSSKHLIYKLSSHADLSLSKSRGTKKDLLPTFLDRKILVLDNYFMYQLTSKTGVHSYFARKGLL